MLYLHHWFSNAHQTHLFRTQITGSTPEFLVQGWSWGLKICISNKLPGNADTSDLGTTLWEILTYITHLRLTKTLYDIIFFSRLDGETETQRGHPEPKNLWTRTLAITTERRAFFWGPHRSFNSLCFQFTNNKTQTSKKKPQLFRKSQENPEHVQLLPVVGEWAPNPRVVMGGRAMDYRAAWPEQGSPRSCRLIKAPPQLPWTFLSLLLQFIWHSPSLLIHSHLGGKKKSGNELSSMLTFLSNSWRCGVPRNGYFLPFLPSVNSQVSSKWFQMHADYSGQLPGEKWK